MIRDESVLRNHTTASQCAKILAILQAGKAITPLEALDELGCSRLGARIYDLKQQGHAIRKRMIKVYNRYGVPCHVAEYSMGHGNAVQGCSAV